MLPFDPTDPFPLLPPGLHSYAEAQEHSEYVDRWLGFDLNKIENELLTRPSCDESGTDAPQRLWIGLSPQAMLTPYTEIRSILAKLAPQAGETVVDLGAGYGRMGLVIGRHYPEVHFLGYEFVNPRVAEAQRIFARMNFSSSSIRMQRADLNVAGFVPLEASFYFIYDFGTRQAIEHSLASLRTIARHKPITVVGRGRASRDAIERRHPWLSQIVVPEHYGHYSIFRSA